jgi:2-keto-3-deoxy-galactonokinase
MTETVLREIYLYLREHELVRNESEFSKNWLGKSDCYMRTLRYKKAEPSIGSFAICAVRLEHTRKQLSSHSVADDLRRYSELCRNHVTASAPQNLHQLGNSV